MHLRSIRTFLLTAALTLPLGAADAELLRLTRSDVNFLLGVRLSDIAASPLVRTMLDEALASKPEWQAAAGMMGSNPLEGFDEVLIAANIDTQSPQDPKDALIVFSGALDRQRLEGIFCGEGCDREQYRDVELRKWNVRMPIRRGSWPCSTADTRRWANVRRCCGRSTVFRTGFRRRSPPKCRAGSTGSGATTCGWPPKARSKRRARQSPVPR
jgi:hypothetical protein